MFWLSKFFTKGKTVQEGIEQFVRFNKRQPDKLETIKIKNAFMEANRPSKIIEFPKERITDWTKARPTAPVKKTEEYPGQFLHDRQSKELEAIDPNKPGLGFYSEMSEMLARHDKERLKFEYDEFFEKLLEKAKIVDTDPKVLLQAELGKKLTGKETFDQLLEFFKKRPKKAGGGLAGMLGERTGYKTGLKVYPKVDILQTGETPNGLDVDVRDITYGGTGIYQGNNWFGGAEGLTGNVKVDVQKDGNTLFKDTMSKEDTVNFIAGLGNIEGDKFQIKADKDLNNVSIVFKKTFAGGGLAPMLGEPTYADGGRIGFKLGGIDKARRAFLQWLGVGAAGVTAAKSGLLGLLKGGGKKAVVKDLTSVPIKNIEGMPAWFKPLVNKVIKEGEEVSGDLERVITHKSKLPNSKTDVYVTQDLTSGDVVVDIGMGKHGWADGHYGQPVRLEYKAAEDIMSGPSDEPFKVGVRDPLLREKVSIHEDLVKDIKPGKEGLRLKPGKTKEEFWVEEAEFSGGHPENIKFEESTFEKFGEHGSNFDEVEKFATGKVKKSKPTKKKLRTEYESGKAEADAEAYWDEHGDFASGGRVPFFLGGRYKEGAALLRNMIKYFAKESKHGKKPSEYLKISNPKQYQKLLNDLSMYKKYSPGEGIMAPDMIKDMIKKTGVERAGVIEHIIGAARNIKKADDSTAAYTKTVVDDLVKKGADKKTAEMFAEGMSKAVTKGIGPKNTPKITDQGLLELETIYKNMLMKEGRKLNATGGRVSLSAGGLAGMLGE